MLTIVVGGIALIDVVRGSNACHVCQHPIAWAGNIFGGLVVAHGSEVSAEVTVVGKTGNMIDLGVQIQCEACNAINQFTAQQTVL
jgi:hypothetical protein